ncbi:MAG: glyoxalase, partial [Pseudomonadota bacterium]
MLGLTPGPRPDFSFPGAWLYSGDHPVIHVIGADPAPTPDPENLSLQHFSLRGEDLAGLPATLRREGVPWRASQMPSGPADIVLVN